MKKTLEYVFADVEEELERAKAKYPDDRWPWNKDLTIFEMVALVANEAGEALQAANKYYYNGDHQVKEIRAELVQVMSTALRVIQQIDNGFINHYDIKYAKQTIKDMSPCRMR